MVSIAEQFSAGRNYSPKIVREVRTEIAIISSFQRREILLMRGPLFRVAIRGSFSPSRTIHLRHLSLEAT